MAEYASYIYVKRKEYIEKLGPYVREINSLLSGGKDIIEIGYKADITVEKSEREAVKEAYIKRFTENLDREIAAGTTLYGPMRDDIEILISGMEARRFASQGQQRSIVLSMKLAEGEVIKEIFGEYPVFLFDDVLSELDSDRRKYLTSRISDRQIIITSCTDEDVRDIAENVILVEGGKYVSSHR